MITWITENVAIGEYIDAINEELLKKEKIDCILCLRFDVSIREEKIKDSLKIPLFHSPVGGGTYQELEAIKIELRTAVYMLEELVMKYKRILVHCTAGIDRSPFVVAYWIAGVDFDKFPNLTRENFVSALGEVYRVVKGLRPQIVEHYEWL